MVGLKNGGYNQPMLEKPDLNDAKIIACLADEFGLFVAQLDFLPLGADLNTAVFRATTPDNTKYFVKLRSGKFEPASVAVPAFLSRLGIKQVVPSLLTAAGQHWANVDKYKVILYPFVDGHNGFEIDITDAQRIEFGAAMRQFHTAPIPPEITKNIPSETFSAQWREKVKTFLMQVEAQSFIDPLAAELAEFLRVQKALTIELVNRAERYAAHLQQQQPEFILCHGDIHGWNLLIDAQGNLFMVDWDTLIFAPKERDLMFVGSGLAGNGHTLAEESALFYQGYGQTTINEIALAYYRYERIIEDIAIYCDQIFLSDDGGEDRKQAFAYLKSNYLPDNTIEIAMQSDQALDSLS